MLKHVLCTCDAIITAAGRIPANEAFCFVKSTSADAEKTFDIDSLNKASGVGPASVSCVSLGQRETLIKRAPLVSGDVVAPCLHCFGQPAAKFGPQLGVCCDGVVVGRLGDEPLIQELQRSQAEALQLAPYLGRVSTCPRRLVVAINGVPEYPPIVNYLRSGRWQIAV